jgi:hypothetical protein
MIPEELTEEFGSRGMQVMVQPTKEACGLFNGIGAREKVMVALHLTC